MKIEEMTGNALDELVGKGGKVVCDFWASWCGPCRMLAPVLEQMAEEFSDRAAFAKVNVDENGDLAASLGIYSIPDVFVFENGKVKAHQTGYVPEERMREFLRENLG